MRSLGLNGRPRLAGFVDATGDFLLGLLGVDFVVLVGGGAEGLR